MLNCWDNNYQSRRNVAGEGRHFPTKRLTAICIKALATELRAKTLEEREQRERMRRRRILKTGEGGEKPEASHWVFSAILE